MEPKDGITTFQLERTPLAQDEFDSFTIDDDEVIEAQCDLENPEICDSCQ